ncbi:MAG TPA: pantetheine-phosphate adenylyltransferase [Sedimentibacter sp.]|nr:pantetheine-phosphate adenylyltransferase [Sedimentibacter sp.]HNZ82171.1 pantetheine-phosphate adenylyltransferase [Sedimentibacter sp.]HOH68939.1 pantetheine-phosphate adenylyltransferase [Sedimentibacter sp.]HQB63960.1 pantetheine-phosphate adenylyltransferase [Sedimentibacter sp.]
MRVLYTGSFDPITVGHLDIIKRISKKFDTVIVTVFNNQEKKYWFPIEERCEMVRAAVEGLTNVEVDFTSGLVVDYCARKDISIIVRGLRAVSDYEYELSISSINKHLSKELETFFLVATPQYSFLSSSMVKDVAEHGGRFEDLVPENVVQNIYRLLGRK